MINVTLKLGSFLRKAPTISKQEWLKIGAKAIQTICERLAQGRGIDDRKMNKLSPGYAKKKRRIGQEAIRNLMFSGAMLGSLTVVESTDHSVRIGFTRRSELIKAEANQKRAPWYGISRKDEDVITRFAANLVRSRK